MKIQDASEPIYGRNSHEIDHQQQVKVVVKIISSERRLDKEKVIEG
jgi:hypothetical protein